ncbi:hypothetical protein D915_003915 [Fasciola hepatica]|uniref:Uncharacterized protein n=1 Tax=Fasciola hepatica TaxID=6192 RepID=A0A4E0RER6_FASHE|nr:hypothetical protein D915_003915 [Fasciola hepatica]
MVLAYLCTLVFVFVSFHDVNSLYLGPRIIDGIKSANSRWEETWQTATTLLAAIAESIRLIPGPNSELGYTGDSITKMLDKQKSIYASVSRDIMAFHTIREYRSVYMRIPIFSQVTPRFFASQLSY